LKKVAPEGIEISCLIHFCVCHSRVNSIVPFLRVSKMRNAAIVRPPSTIAGIVGEICNGLDELLREVGIEATTFVYNYSSPLSTDSVSDIKRIGKLIADENFDVAICCGSSADPNEALATSFRENNWTPKIAFSATDNPWITPNSQYWIVADTVRAACSRCGLTASRRLVHRPKKATF
jgi:hypothetical protein